MSVEGKPKRKSGYSIPRFSINFHLDFFSCQTFIHNLQQFIFGHPWHMNLNDGLRHNMNVDGRSIAQEPIDRIEVSQLAPAFSREPSENHLCDMLFPHELSGRISHACSLKTNRLCAQAFRELEIGFEGFFVLNAV